MNHFVRGNIALDTLPALAELTTLGGRIIKFTRRRGKLLANGVPVTTESEREVSRGRIFFIDELLFVDYDRVFELQSQYGDLETAPLLGTPWPSSQFLSHLLGWAEEQPQTSFFAEYLNYTNLAYMVPGHDDELEPVKYTAFIPTDEVVTASLYADASDPFLLDEELRNTLVLNHLVSGRLYHDDLKAATTLTTLANTTLTVTTSPEGEVEVGGVRVLGPHTFLYNLGNVYLVDGLLGVTDQDIVTSINEFSHRDGSVQQGSKTKLDLNPAVEEPRTSPAPTQDSTPSPPLAPPTTTPTTTTSTTRAPRPRTTTASTTRAPRRRTTTARATRRLPRLTTPQPTSTTPRPTSTTPRIRFETRTEISVSRRVNDGALETVNDSSR
ncbi:hypothetical protein GWK47_029207 [Chionoecetes opilio]|uniref:FAS1 domain-containing protein n=1 Tax=Chionoecetes opilio TaxID=41210 RepID=A0A8J4YWP7_CHIOP|nr:hypothetical protein GWK47_029207 [Chionoecetes opilio]